MLRGKSGFGRRKVRVSDVGVDSVIKNRFINIDFVAVVAVVAVQNRMYARSILYLYIFIYKYIDYYLKFV